MDKLNTDVLVIGSGPGGYPAAIRAAQLGNSVIIVEKGLIGGECLNWGCIPSKALISASNFFHKLKKKSQIMGIQVNETNLDYGVTQEWKRGIQNKLITGIKQLLKGNQVTTIGGVAKFLDQHLAKVKKTDGTETTIQFNNAIIATGTEFIQIPKFKIDNEFVLSAKGLLEHEKIPKNLVVIGGGIIGLELGTTFAKFGSNVTIVELLPDILPGVDTQLSRMLIRNLKDLGIKLYTSSTAMEYIKNSEKGPYVKIKNDKGENTILADKILLSIGKKADTSDLNLKATGVKLNEKGFIIINRKQQTNIPTIFAVGDCTGPPFLAHRATKQGIVAAEVLSGLASESDFKAIPGAIFTDPEIAYAGMSEKEAKKAGFEVKTGRASFSTSARALTHLSTTGYVKVISDAKTEEILGVQIIGPEATDLISEAVLALEMGATLEDIALSVHPHPTLPEMLMEASEAALGKAIHQINPKPDNM
ncbi:MAG: dihydrolipoyl dehydrogenase [Candidatus Hodarchaeales archaeon]|jgi:dihydrolipoamide dehydrogenase